ncbi:MAG: type II and III secretion system protein, partial [candidate division WOR-3 bacterium]
QVLIKGRIVEVDYNESRRLGSELKAIRFGNPSFSASPYVAGGTEPENPTYLTVNYLGPNAARIEAAIDALEGQSKANTISEPKIMVLDNEKASIQFEETGITLEVTPHIIPDGKVVLHVKTETGDLVGYSAAGQPITSKRGAETKVTVGDGETVLIGGVIIEKDKRAKSGLPLILRIPFIGQIFGRYTKEGSKAEILIFLTPSVVRE